MASFTELGNPKLVSRGYEPQEYNFTSFYDVAAAAYKYQRDTMNIDSTQQMLSEGYTKRRNQLISLDRGTFGGTEKYGKLPESKVDEIIKQKRNEGDTQYAGIATTDELMKTIPDRKRAAKTEYENTYMKAAPDVHKDVASILGMFPAAVTDMPNLLTLALGGGGRSIGQVVFREAVLNAGIEAAQQPYIREIQQDLGYEYTVGDMAESIGYAALFGGAFPVAIKGSTMAAGVIKNTWHRVAPSERAVMTASMKQHMADEAVPGVKTPEKYDASVRNTETTLKAMGARRVPREDELDAVASPPKLDSDDLPQRTALANKGKTDAEKSTNTKQSFVKAAIEDETESAKRILLPDQEQSIKAKVKALDKRIEDVSKAKHSKSAPEEKVAEFNAAKQVAISKAKMDRLALLKQLNNHKKALKSVENLAELNKGRVPKSLERRFTSFKKAVDEAPTERSPVMEAATRRQDDIGDSKELDDATKSGELDAANEKEVQRILVDDPNAFFVDADGERVLIRDVLADLDADIKKAEIIKGCAL